MTFDVHNFCVAFYPHINQTDLSQPVLKCNALLAALGLSPEEVIAITEPEVDKILGWLEARDLHFGYSAFYALQHLLEESGRAVPLRDIAVESILVDILAGVIHPLTQGELELSLYALQKVGVHYGLSLNAAHMDFEGLKEQLVLGAESPGPARGVLVHIKGNHYALVTKNE